MRCSKCSDIHFISEQSLDRRKTDSYFCFSLLVNDIDGALRLTSGKGSHEGRLEVYYSGQWGTICDDGWTELNTQVACRQLGFK